MAISFVAATSIGYPLGQTTVVGTVPSGVVNSDLLIWGLYGNVATLQTVLTGWTAVPSASLSGTAQQLNVWYRFASSEPASYTATVATSRWAAGMLAFRGVDTTTPFDVVAAATAGTTAIAFSAVTPATAAAYVVALGGVIVANSVVNTTFSSTNLDALPVNGSTTGAHSTGTSTNAALGVGYEAWSSGAFTAAMAKSNTSTRTVGSRLALRPAPVSTAFRGWGQPARLAA